MSTSTEDNTVDVDAQKVPCVVCKEPIHRRARICVHCDSTQDWTRYLLQFSKLAGALIGVVSIASVAFSLSNLVPSKAQLSFVPLACTTEGIDVAVTNLGDKPALVLGATLTLSTDFKKKSKKDKPVKKDRKLLTASETIVASNKTKELSLHWLVSGNRQDLPEKRVTMGSCVYIIGKRSDPRVHSSSRA